MTRDVMDVIGRGVSDAFCASAKSFNRRGAKILFDETLFEKGKMFSLADGDFEVRIYLVLYVFYIISRRYQSLGFTISK